MKTPILFTIFKRPEVTKRVFDVIRNARPEVLFVGADGPRPGEEGKCKETREVIKVDWPCELMTLYQEVNLGGKWGGYTATKWFFDNVDEGIILEDDDLPDPTFFTYCEELLDRYRNDVRIGTISGDNFQFGKNRTPYSYFFSKYFHSWGWASWKRTWSLLDPDIKDWPIYRDTNWIGNFLDSPREIPYWTSIMDQIFNGRSDSWDYPLCFTLWKHQMLNIHPSDNLVSNIGTYDSTHEMSTSPMVNLPRIPMKFPMNHPVTIKRNIMADIATEHFYR